MATTQTKDEALETGGFDAELGLYATAPQPLPFAPSLHIRGFVLPREAGNVLIYSTGRLADDAAGIAEIGDIRRHYLNHHHEAMFASDWVDAPLFVHEDDSGPTAEAYEIRGTFDRRHTFEGDLEVIPIPGHTPGATAYLWDSGERRFLFTGDSLYLHRGEWVAAVLASSDRDRYIESLELLRSLDFDVLVPWAASAGDPFHARIDHDDARERIGEVLDRVRSGSDR